MKVMRILKGEVEVTPLYSMDDSDNRIKVRNDVIRALAKSKSHATQTINLLDTMDYDAMFKIFDGDYTDVGPKTGMLMFYGLNAQFAANEFTKLVRYKAPITYVDAEELADMVNAECFKSNPIFVNDIYRLFDVEASNVGGRYGWLSSENISFDIVALNVEDCPDVSLLTCKPSHIFIKGEVRC